MTVCSLARWPQRHSSRPLGGGVPDFLEGTPRLLLFTLPHSGGARWREGVPGSILAQWGARVDKNAREFISSPSQLGVTLSGPGNGRGSKKKAAASERMER